MSAGAVRLLAPLALRDLLGGLLPDLPLAVETEIVLNPEVPRRAAAGHPFDVAILNPWYVPELVAAGHLAADGVVALGRIPLAVGVRAGASVTDELETLLTEAETIAYTGAGTSGATFLGALDRIGLRTVLADRLRPLPAGGPVRAVAAGEVSLAIAPLTTLAAAPGVVTAAVFPEGLGTDIPQSLAFAPAARPGAVRLRDALMDPARDAEMAAAGLYRPA
ncbi:substrate-binding domain-containing protein [Jannaschia seohaensis]|uniref:Molybdate transport system substrate-binding protein n=1 Tax=Jannaschia seohaensis TaxID=475081 RepID=A0A2Y9B8W4_9RHOB|nr:substrate-binding domain-containing protein [Jannaschia seohaensis]PWJ11467.1 hypothetical protein BCF38_11934 [Jannaschia seohaensis]SSA51447.1 hypothetical protein SAMN05421539_11934 [Jannaschia seohaensis]